MLNICDVFPIRKNLIRNFIDTPSTRQVRNAIGTQVKPAVSPLATLGVGRCGRPPSMGRRGTPLQDLSP